MRCFCVVTFYTLCTLKTNRCKYTAPNPPSNHLLTAGGRAVSTPDYPEPLRSSLTDADSLSLQRDQWPRRNVPHPTQVPHVTSTLPEPLQNSMADAEYVNVRRPQQ